MWFEPDKKQNKTKTNSNKKINMFFKYIGLYTYRCYSPVYCVSGALSCFVCSFLFVFSLQPLYFLFCTNFEDIQVDVIS